MLSKLIAALIAVALVAGGWAIRPRSLELADDQTGDPALLLSDVAAPIDQFATKLLAEES